MISKMTIVGTSAEKSMCTMVCSIYLACIIQLCINRRKSCYVNDTIPSHALSLHSFFITLPQSTHVLVLFPPQTVQYFDQSLQDILHFSQLLPIDCIAPSSSVQHFSPLYGLHWLNPAASHWGSIDGVLVPAYIARTLADTSVPEQQNSRTSSPTTTFVSIRWNWIFTFAFSGPQDLPDGY